jgi:hypothetical protein
MLLGSLPAHAQLSLTGAGGFGGGSTFVGPGDVVSGALMWWGTRCYSNAYSGNVVDVVDASTGDTTGTRLQCSSGSLVALTSASACTFVTGNACSPLATTCASGCNIVNLYDQIGTACTGGCTLTQATNANRPAFTVSCVNGHPCMTFPSNTSAILANLSGTISTQAQPFTLSAVWNVTSTCPQSFGCFVWIDDPNGNFISLFPNTSVLAINFNAVSGGTASTADDIYSIGNQQITQLVFDNASSVLNLNGSPVSFTGTVGTNGPTSGAEIAIGNDTFGDVFSGNIAEVGVWPFGFNSTQQTNMFANQAAFW